MTPVGHSGGDGGEAGAQNAQEHGSQIYEIAVFIEKGLLFVVEVGSSSRMHRHGRALVGLRRFDLVRQFLELGDP